MATLCVTLTGPPKPGARHPYEARRHVVKDKIPALFPDQLLKFQEELQQRRQEGYKVTFTDFWGLLIEACLGDEVGAQLPLGAQPARADAQPSAFMRASREVRHSMRELDLRVGASLGCKKLEASERLMEPDGGIVIPTSF